MCAHDVRTGFCVAKSCHADTSFRQKIAQAAVVAAILLQVDPLAAQGTLQPGEAFVTRFSGTTTVAGPGGAPVSMIDPAGAVAVVIDVRSPNRTPQGAHWIDKPRRIAVTAAQVGQVFGVTLDGATPPNVYVAATSAFGLHRTRDNAQWMPGMWGPGGGPGTIYKVDGQTGQPQVFANITLNGRPNSGAGLGNMAFDRWNQQLFVSNLETGMIHRIRLPDGSDLGYYDHGVQGRANFTDADIKQRASLPPIPLNTTLQARIADCPSGDFQWSPNCWNLAPNGRRVWGLAVGRTAADGGLRLYYSVASGPEFGQTDWSGLGQKEQRHSVWSVKLGAGGAFDPSDVRREFVLTDFFVEQTDIARAGFSRPVSDIAFPVCTDRPIMLIAERGGNRNLGLDAENPFATPHEARATRYELHQDGVWRPVGRYDIGSYSRLAEGSPRLLANCAGGIAFGYGYSANWTLDRGQPDQSVWITGDALCSPNGQCNAPGVAATPGQQAAPQQTTGQAQAAGDPSEVHGIQGLRENAFAELAPASAFAGATPVQQASNVAIEAIGLDQAYLVDTDVMIDAQGTLSYEELTRNDATLVGDIAIYEVCPTLAQGFVPLLAAPAVMIFEVGHSPGASHVRFASHNLQYSHFRYGSHWPVMSHNKWGSHFPPGSAGHWPPGSLSHWPPGSIPHWPPGSVGHWPPGSAHWPPGSGHWPPGSVHFPPGSKHFPPGSVHFPPGSKLHIPIGSVHVPVGSKHFPPGSVLGHLPVGSKHFPPGSLHVPVGSVHFPPGSKHIPIGSLIHKPPASPGHLPPGSGHFPPGSAHFPPGSVHVPLGSTHVPPGSAVHKPPASGGAHLPLVSAAKLQHLPPGSAQHIPPGSAQKHLPAGSTLHVPSASAAKQHLPAISAGKLHLPAASAKQHLPAVSAGKQHLPAASAKQQHLPAVSVKQQHLPAVSVKQQHLPPGSAKQHLPPGSVRQHLPPDSAKQHLPPGSVRQHLPAASQKQVKPQVQIKQLQQQLPPDSVKQQHLPQASAGQMRQQIR